MIPDRIDQISVTEGSGTPATISGTSAIGGIPVRCDYCDGRCCKCFDISTRSKVYSLKDIKILYKDEKQRKFNELDIILPMLKVVKRSKVNPFFKMKGGQLHPGIIRTFFRCLHITPNGRCSIYYRRPQLCRSFSPKNCTYE